MPRRPAKITEAEISRAYRVAQKFGAKSISLNGEGVIRIELPTGAEPTADLDAADAADAAEPANDEAPTWTPSEDLRRYLDSTESG